MLGRRGRGRFSPDENDTVSINTPISCVAFFLVCVLLCFPAAAQEESIGTSSCTRYNALTLIQQQIDLMKTFDDDARRVPVLIRAADLMWPYQQKKARTAFVEAFETAKRHFREKGDRPPRDGKLLIGLPDQRYTVISAIAKRDSGWARKLTDQLLKEQREDANGEAIKDAERDIRTAERLLTVAGSLVSTHEAVAVNFARSSLQYPATFYLSQFLYQLASANRPAADQFYHQALTAYANAPIERLLYLSSYPFGNDREAGEMPGSTVYQVPNGFVPNLNLQRLFVQTLLRRAQDYINNPSELASGGRLSEPEQMWLAFTRLEKQIQGSLPNMAAAVEAARGNLYAMLSQDSQRNAVAIFSRDNRPKRSFAEQVETALKNPNVDRRDQQLTSAIISTSKDETLAHVLEAVDKISDSNIRQPLLNWLYFDRAQRAIKDQKLDEARKLAAKVEELDQRAFLYFRITDESLKSNPDQSEAREILEEVVVATAKAPNTVVTARALLGVAYLYSKFDANRAVGLMAEAVKLVNRVDQADFSRQFVIRKIEGKTFSSYASFATPGFNPENAFREIGKVDFDGMLNQASNLSDKSLRAMSILMLVERCLKDEVPRTRSKRIETASPAQWTYKR